MPLLILKNFFGSFLDFCKITSQKGRPQISQMTRSEQRFLASAF